MLELVAGFNCVVDCSFWRFWFCGLLFCLGLVLLGLCVCLVLVMVVYKWYVLYVTSVAVNCLRADCMGLVVVILFVVRFCFRWF